MYDPKITGRKGAVDGMAGYAMLAAGSAVLALLTDAGFVAWLGAKVPVMYFPLFSAAVTIIVNVLKNWSRPVEDHVTPPALRG